MSDMEELLEHPFDRAKRKSAEMICVPPARYFDEHVLMHRGQVDGELFKCENCGRHYFSRRDLPVSCVRGFCK